VGGEVSAFCECSHSLGLFVTVFSRPDVFPNGIESLYSKTGWLVQAHNRYWAEDAVYAKQNGGDYDFSVDSIKHGSVPTEQRFWDDLFSKSTSAWGLRVYEQDWLFNEMYQYVSEMLSTVDRARTWLMQMGAGAAHAGLTIQYCMPYIRFLLQSVEVAAVTQARASDDYVVAPYDGVDNWRIAGQSILIDALGLAPSKDGFWTTAFQPGNPYGEDRYEPNPRLHSVVGSLSAGPVQIADGIGYTDVALVMRSCAKDGRLLQASMPATVLDVLLISRAVAASSAVHGRSHSEAHGSLPNANSEIWYAPSSISSRTFGYVFVADLDVEYQLSPRHLVPTIPFSSKFRAFESNSTSAVVDFSAETPLLLAACRELDFQLWSIAPVEVNGWSFQGELNKWVGVSPARFRSITTTLEPAVGISVTAHGSEAEELVVGFVDSYGVQVIVSCTVGNTGTVVIHSSGSCSTSNS
jgi:hypothetical protein